MPLCGNRGKGGPSKTVDEDVGSRFMGKHFGVRLFEGECFPVIGRRCGGTKAPPYRFVQTMRLHSPPLVRGGGPHERWWGSNNAVLANIAATSAFPKKAVLGYAEHVDMPLCGNRGKWDRRRRWMRMSAVALWGNALAFDYLWGVPFHCRSRIAGGQ